MASTIVTPLLIAKPFGYSAANPTYITLPIPDPSQISGTINKASFETGFPPATMTPEASGGLPFFGQDMNGILWMVSAYCANYAAGKLSVYNSTLSSAISGYPMGSLTLSADGNGLWINGVDGNSTDPDALGANWAPLAFVGTRGVTLGGSDVTLSAAQASSPYIGFNGTLTANVNVIVPAWGGRSWVFASGCSGAFTVTVKTAAGSGVVVPATGASAPTSVFCDGVNIQNTGVSTAGLAPINSPALTGTPTAPTASPATLANTQIANTQFTQNAITAALATYAPLASPVFSGVPTAPTPTLSDNSLKLATTAFVKSAIASLLPQVRGGTFTCVNGNVSVAFAVPFPNACLAVVCTGEYVGWDLGNIVPGTRSTTGFQYHNANSGVMGYIAYGN